MRLTKMDRTARVTTKKERITIDRTTETVEIDLDFTQMYNCFFYLSMGIKTASSFQILFFLLRNMSKDNQVSINKELLKQYSDICHQLGLVAVSEQTFYSALKELQRAGVMVKLSRGQYFMNPYAMWKENSKNRKEYLQIDAGVGQRMAINPIDLLINAPDSHTIIEELSNTEALDIYNGH
jgi:hypothetical protein